jgi:hypothetical protein
MPFNQKKPDQKSKELTMHRTYKLYNSNGDLLGLLQEGGSLDAFSEILKSYQNSSGTNQDIEIINNQFKDKGWQIEPKQNSDAKVIMPTSKQSTTQTTKPKPGTRISYLPKRIGLDADAFADYIKRTVAL